MDDIDLQALEKWMEPFLEKLEASERRKLFKRIATGLRNRQAARISEQHNPDGSKFEPRKHRRKKGRIKRQMKMFLRLRMARHLQARSTDNAAGAGFKGMAAKIARVHIEGLSDEVTPGGPLYRYPIRKLLGFSDDDRDFILEELNNHFLL